MPAKPPRTEKVTAKATIINPHHVIIKTPNAEYFQSYQSTIVKTTSTGRVYLDAEAWDYSPTTSKYRNMYLRETTKETAEKIASGKYKLVNLNG